MNIEQITDRYLDKLYKIDHLHDFMWKKKELVDFAGFVLESVIKQEGADIQRKEEPCPYCGRPIHFISFKKGIDVITMMEEG